MNSKLANEIKRARKALSEGCLINAETGKKLVRSEEVCAALGKKLQLDICQCKVMMSPLRELLEKARKLIDAIRAQQDEGEVIEKAIGEIWGTTMQDQRTSEQSLGKWAETTEQAERRFNEIDNEVFSLREVMEDADQALKVVSDTLMMLAEESYEAVFVEEKASGFMAYLLNADDELVRMQVEREKSAECAEQIFLEMAIKQHDAMAAKTWQERMSASVSNVQPDARQRETGEVVRDTSEKTRS